MPVKPYISGLIACLLLGTPLAFADDMAPSAPAAAEGAAAASPSIALLARKADLLTQIESLRGAGVGVGPYLKQMEEINQLIHSGGPEDQITKRYDSLSGAIKDQAERSQALKSYHPTPSASSSGSFPALGPGGGGGAGLGLGSGAPNSALVDSVKEKLGGKLPGGLSQDDVMKMLANPKAQEMLNKLK